MASNSSVRSRSQKELTEGLAAVPSALTAFSSKDSWIYQITVCNNTAAPVTFLVQDQQATPIVLIPTISIAANTTYVIDFPEGVKMISGIKWQAGAATSLYSEIFGFTL